MTLQAAMFSAMAQKIIIRLLRGMNVVHLYYGEGNAEVSAVTVAQSLYMAKMGKHILASDGKAQAGPFYVTVGRRTTLIKDVDYLFCFTVADSGPFVIHVQDNVIAGFLQCQTDRAALR